MYETCVEYMYILEYFESLLIYLNVYCYFQIPTSFQIRMQVYIIIIQLNYINQDILSYNLKYRSRVMNSNTFLAIYHNRKS